MPPQSTLPERILEEALRDRNVNFDIQLKGVPGTPDFAFPELRFAIFVHGCFWHRHLGCQSARTPRRDRYEWSRRFAANVQRDQAVTRQLHAMDWWTFAAWECEIYRDAAAVATAILAERGRREHVLRKRSVPGVSRSEIHATHY